MKHKVGLLIVLLASLACKNTSGQGQENTADPTVSGTDVQSIAFHREGLGQMGYDPGKWFILTEKDLTAVSPEMPQDTLQLNTGLFELCSPIWSGLPAMLKNQAEWGISESTYDGDGWKMIVKYHDQSQVTVFSGNLPEDLRQFEKTVAEVLVELEKNNR